MTMNGSGVGPPTTVLPSHRARPAASPRRTAAPRAVYAAIVTAAAAAVVVVDGCGPTKVDPPRNPPSVASTTAAAPTGPPGAFVPPGFIAFIPPTHLFTVMVPAGWSRVDATASTTFSDQVDAIQIEQQSAAVPPSPETVRLHDLPVLGAASANYLTAAVSVVHRRAGPAVSTTYQTVAPHSLVDPKASVEVVERYQFWRNGQEAILTLSGPAGFDNTTLWRTITDSLQWL